MKAQADKHKTDREYAMGDLMNVKLQPYHQFSVAQRLDHKLAPKFFSPFPVVLRIGSVAYRLQLPPTSKIRPIFHISQLRKARWPSPSSEYTTRTGWPGANGCRTSCCVGQKAGQERQPCYGVCSNTMVHWLHRGCHLGALHGYEKRFPSFDLSA